MAGVPAIGRALLPEMPGEGERAFVVGLASARAAGPFQSREYRSASARLFPSTIISQST